MPMTRDTTVLCHDVTPPLAMGAVLALAGHPSYRSAPPRPRSSTRRALPRERCPMPPSSTSACPTWTASNCAAASRHPGIAPCPLCTSRGLHRPVDRSPGLARAPSALSAVPVEPGRARPSSGLRSRRPARATIGRPGRRLTTSPWRPPPCTGRVPCGSRTRPRGGHAAYLVPGHRLRVRTDATSHAGGAARPARTTEIAASPGAPPRHGRAAPALRGDSVLAPAPLWPPELFRRAKGPGSCSPAARPTSRPFCLAVPARLP